MSRCSVSVRLSSRRSLLQHLELLTEQVQALQKAVRALQQERKA